MDYSEIFTIIKFMCKYAPWFPTMYILVHTHVCVLFGECKLQASDIKPSDQKKCQMNPNPAIPLSFSILKPNGWIYPKFDLFLHYQFSSRHSMLLYLHVSIKGYGHQHNNLSVPSTLFKDIQRFTLWASIDPVWSQVVF